MPKFAIFNDEGTVLRTLDVAPHHIEAQLQDGEQYLMCDAKPHDRIDVATLQVISCEAPARRVDSEPEYAQRRQAAYPSIGYQLDQFWHAMNAGDFPKLEPWFSQIKAVKDANPK